MGKEEESTIEVFSVGDEGEKGTLPDRVAGVLRSSSDRLASGSQTRVDNRIEKADSDVEPTSLPPEGSEMVSAFATVSVLEPPYPPDFLLELYRRSNSMRQNIDAYKTNIDGFGYTLEPVVDLDSDDAWGLAVAELEEQMEQGADLKEEEWEELIKRRIVRYKKEAAAEKVGTKNFFDFAGLDMSFVQLRKRTRQDLEIFGWGGWEVLRNKAGEMSKFAHVPGHTLRIAPPDKDKPLPVSERQRRGPFDIEEITIHKYFRTFVHWVGNQGLYGKIIYLKEYGDPRTVSRSTGQPYVSIEALRAEEGAEALSANELLYFDLHNPDSEYGESRWMGNLLSILGSRESEEVNYFYFRNKSIPPMVLLVSGGRVGKEDKEKLKEYIETELKGNTENFHKILIIVARSDKNTGEAPKMEFKPLTEAMLNEGVFQKYDERNIDKVGSAFRLPRMLRGDIRDFNKSTAEAALRFTEAQVFQGERADFDFIMNQKIMMALGSRYWNFHSNAPPLQDPESVVDMVERLVKANVMTPAEGRRQLARAGISLDVIDEPWTKRPVVFTLAGIGFEPEEGEVIAQPQQGAPVQQGLKSLEKQLFERLNISQTTVEELMGLNKEELEKRLLSLGLENDDLLDVMDLINT